MGTRKITRRDFVNGTLVGAGVALTGNLIAEDSFSAKPEWSHGLVDGRWYGPGGVGDFADCHGNSPDVVNKAHAIRDRHFDSKLRNVEETGELYDVAVVGCGIAGLGAAYHFIRDAPSDKRCLMLDNHSVFGGESKENEFDVNGHRLISPQGANGFSVPDFRSEAQDFAGGDAYWYRELGVPESFQYGEWDTSFKPLKFGGDHYGFIHWLQDDISTGRYFNTPDGQELVLDPWKDELARAPLSESKRRALLDFFSSGPKPQAELGPWLDSMTYQELLESILGLDSDATRYISPIVASGVGLGADVVSAYSCYNIALPGFKGVSDFSIGERHSFPGGNGGFARYFLKRLIPDSIVGQDNFEDIILGRINFAALDRNDNKIRMRLSATVVRVEHGPKDIVSIIYTKGDKLYRVRAKSVVMAGGGWINKRVVKDLPESHIDAYNSYTHAPFLVANVALNNWRFMYNAGMTGCLYDGDFGFACNVRRQMQVGDYRPPLDPDQPTVLTFYVPFIYPGEPALSQAIRGRTELFTKNFAEYERLIATQMHELFSGFGFDAGHDIAGIILNRWGHAYVVPEPGFYFGTDGKPAAPDVVNKPYGRISFGHSELRGNQHWGPAAMEGMRAMSEAMSVI